MDFDRQYFGILAIFQGMWTRSHQAANAILQMVVLLAMRLPPALPHGA